MPAIDKTIDFANKMKDVWAKPENVPNVPDVKVGLSTVIWNDQLWVAYLPKDDKTFDLRILQSPFAEDITNQQLWSKPTLPSGDELHTNFRPILVTNGAKLYALSGGSRGDYKGKIAIGSFDTDQNEWTDFLQLRNADDKDIALSTDDEVAPFTAVAIGSKLAVVVADSSGEIGYHLFDPEQTWTEETHHLRAEYSETLECADLSGVDSKIGGGKFHAYIDAAIYTQGSAPENYGSDSEDMPSGANYLLCSLGCHIDDHHSPLALTLQLTEDNHLPSSLTTSTVELHLLGDDDSMATVTRDPAGRINAYYSYDVFNVLAIDTKSTGMRGPRGDWSGDVWGGDTIPGNGAVAVFVYGDLVSLDNNTKSRSVRELVFYVSTNSHLHLGTNDYGSFELTTEAELLNLTDESNGGKYFIEGFIDGPPPVPQVNITVSPNGASAYTRYGESSSNERGISTSQSTKVGVKTEGNSSPTIGAGVAWDISMSLGYSDVIEGTESQDYSLSADVHLNLKDNQVQPIGEAFLRKVIIGADTYSFKDHHDKPVRHVPEVSLVSPRWADVLAREYRVTTVTPGELESYKEDKWNEYMRPIYRELLGRDVDYINDIVKPNALKIGESNHLAFSWNRSGGTVQQVSQTNSQFIEESYTFDASIWAGVSAKFLGAEAKLLAGLEFSLKTSSSTVNSESFGVEAQVDVPDPGEEPGVTGYDFQLYFLPPVQLNPDAISWTKEFIETLKLDPNNNSLVDMIDPNSECWKIMYVVTNVEYITTVMRLINFGLSEQTAQELLGREIVTTSQLLHWLGLDTSMDLSRIGAARTEQREEIYRALRKWNQASV